MKKLEKEKFVNDLAKEIKAASCVVLVDYMGLTVKLQQELKSELAKVNASMYVVKNSLFQLAAKKANAPSEAITDELMVGPSAMVITTDDPISPLNVIAKFAKVNELPKFKVGIVENVFQDTNSLTILSTLPGKETLIIQAMGAISAPLYGIVGTLNAPMQKLIYVLSEAAKGGDNS